MNIRKVPESAGNSYFKDLNVCYWQGSTYNSTTENKQCMIDIDLGMPLLDEASNYVCAVERLELSGGNIAYYDSDLEVFKYSGDKISNGGDGSTIQILYNNLNRAAPMVELTCYGKYYSLPQLIQELNRTLTEEEGIYYMNFSIEMSGTISVNFVDENPNNYYFPYLALGFKGTHLASLFGLPEDPLAAGYANAQAWYNHFGNKISNKYRFVTITSRIDCGYIPSLILLRSNLPLESDQTDSSKVNIVTDFSITSTSDVSSSYDIDRFQIGQTNDYIYASVNKGYSWSITGGGTIVYVPNERRWLNFSAPIPIYNIRLWIDIVYNDSTVKTYELPPGGVFRVKFGFYQRE